MMRSRELEDNKQAEEKEIKEILDPKTKPVKLLDPYRVNNKDINEDLSLDIDVLPDDLQDICLTYAVDPTEQKKEENILYPRTFFFKKCLAHQLHEAADDLLWGDGAKALQLVQNNPWVLEWTTEGHDRFETSVQGTLLQIAAMILDVNYYVDKESKDHGMVDLLIKAGRLSDEAVSNQLYPVLFSNEAKEATQKRIKDTSEVIETFLKGLTKKNLPNDWLEPSEFEKAQAICQPEIEMLRKDLLRLVSHQVVTHGQVRPPEIVMEFLKKLEVDDPCLNGFGDLKKDLLCVTCYGSLQWISAAPDAQMYLQGIGFLTKFNQFPSRSLKNSAGVAVFNSDYNSLGFDYYIGLYKSKTVTKDEACHAKVPLGNIISRKMDGLQRYNKNVFDPGVVKNKRRKLS